LKTRQIIAAIQKRFPRAKVIGMSCRTGKGFEEWIKILESKCKSGLNIPDIDYDLYAKGEAELAWFNFAANLYAKSGFSGDKFLQGLVVNIKNALKKLNIEAAHIKMALATECGNSMIHLTRTNGAVEFSKKEAGISDKARLIINARAHTDPDLLHKIIKSALAEICKKMKINIKEDSIQYFRPGRPVPVHRFADTKNPKTLV